MTIHTDTTRSMKLSKATIAAVAAMTLCLQAGAQSVYRSSLPVKAKKGINVSGTVECEGRPVAGVAVSDGYEIVRTDKNGAYYLKSEKRNPQLFISTPSGYEAWRDDAVPQFWADFTEGPEKYERHDFRLRKADQSRHAVIAITDVHLANQKNDVATFCGPYVERLRQETKRLNKEGMPVYTIHLGDGTWDNYWYALDFPVAKMRDALNSAEYPTAFYNVMGNHDNDGAVPHGPDTDMDAARPYMKAFGPRYYSFNAGGVHYVVLDNIEYKNEPSEKPKMPGIWGDRNYNVNFTSEQLDWLEKDLKGISSDTPLVVAMHCPFIRWKGISDTVVPRLEKESSDRFLNIVAPFDEVHTISGHSHKQVVTRLPGEKTRVDHNISGTCGAWWWTSAFGGKNLCPDGSPVGYEVFYSDGNNLKWRHETYEFEPGRQFWAWDMNEVRKYFSEYGEYNVFRKYFPKWTDYSEVPANSIWVNIWAWDPEGKISITENGRELPVEMFLGENPVYNATYPVQRTVWLNQYSQNWEKPHRFRLFRAVASTPDAPVEITWTDPFGNTTRQTLARPASFGPADFR